ncbi:hypothetical protein CICLE_v10026878mg [Citrus x clementina]|uniref:Uncharacterized protein n=2 Tax=Citrus TaxID=2706 RepID=A0A067EZK7_CITSI|nr:hypothetical protein CICLE_v10026878mg [Citrus x clementina]KDO60574.1 hypothetical protein CISIN_1g034966mg [Citrus sinensis]
MSSILVSPFDSLSLTTPYSLSGTFKAIYSSFYSTTSRKRANMFLANNNLQLQLRTLKFHLLLLTCFYEVIKYQPFKYC